MGGKEFSLGKGRRTTGSRQASSLEFSDTITLIVMIAGEALWGQNFVWNLVRFKTHCLICTCFSLRPVDLQNSRYQNARYTAIQNSLPHSSPLISHPQLLFRPIERAIKTPALGDWSSTPRTSCSLSSTPPACVYRSTTPDDAMHAACRLHSALLLPWPGACAPSNYLSAAENESVRNAPRT